MGKTDPLSDGSHSKEETVPVAPTTSTEHRGSTDSAALEVTDLEHIPLTHLAQDFLGFNVANTKMGEVSKHFATDGAKIMGVDNNILAVRLKVSEELMCAPGTFLYACSPITSERMDQKSLTFRTGLASSLGMAASGQLFKTYISNDSSRDINVGLTCDYPNSLLILDFNMRDSRGNSPRYMVNRHAWFASTYPLRQGLQLAGRPMVTAGVAPRSKGVGAACCGAVPLIPQLLEGQHGTCYIGGNGTVIERQLADGESVVIDHEAFLAADMTVVYDIKPVKCKLCCCANQGLFQTVFTGPGRLWVQSMSLGKLRRTFGANQNANATSGKNNESDLGNLLNLVSGAPSTDTGVEK